MPSIKEGNCIWCGKSFKRRVGGTGHSGQFCCRTCANQYHTMGRLIAKGRMPKQLHTYYCVDCGKPIRAFRKVYRCDTCKEKHDSQTYYERNKAIINIKQRKRRIANFKSEAVHCKNCGKLFHTSYCSNKHFCSDECRDRYNKHMNHLRQKKRLKGKIIDADITLEKVAKRDKYICQLCKHKVDPNDYYKDKNGNFVAGPDYPSIDHVVPLSQGGMHEWGNVQLAHCRCNSIKCDSLLAPIIIR